MSMQERVDALGTLEGAYGGKVLTYVTSERRGLESKIAPDAVFLFRRHLERIGEVVKLGLFLVSRGGDTVVPWQIVNLIREYCKTFDVLAPYTAHSAATLISLGADSIYMTKMATLSPTDPTVANAFNPTDPTNPQAKVGIGVEDVTAFMELAKNQGIDKGPELTQVFLALASHVHPLALGNVQRSHTQIRHLARELLKLHMDTTKEEEKIEGIVKMLTEGLRTHEHTINRREASRIGLKVATPEKQLDDTMSSLFDCYVNDLQMFETFNPATLLGNDESRAISIERAYIESAALTDAFVTEATVRRLAPGQMPITSPRVELPPGMGIPQVAIELSFEGWRPLR